MKKYVGFIVFVMMIVLVHPAFAWDNRSKQNSYNKNSFGSTDIEIRNKSDYGSFNKFRGTRESDGSTRVRDSYGNVLRGHVDDDGYGRLRDQDGDTYRVRPR